MEDVPTPDSSVVGRALNSAHAWARWFGPVRLVAASLSVLLVATGAFWLLRAPTPPVEGSLPYSSAVGQTTAVGVGEQQSRAAASTTPPPETDGRVTVHVAGAVAAPGVYELDAGARIDAAIEQAGGVLADADADALNLAAPLPDGSRLFVPFEGEDVPTTVAPALPNAGSGTGGPSGAAGAPAAPVDVNRADRAALQELPGVGPATADAIVTDRELNGPFVTVDDLDRVSGIGPAKIERLRDLVTT